MEPRRIRTALISVYDKTGIVDFASALVTEFGIEIISTGGTAKLLKENGLPVTLVEEITGFPELLDGRVKTLHPKIFAGILADRDNPEHMRQLEAHGIKPIDMVVVNLYPFARTVEDPNCTFEQAIEMIDIGGVALLRAAAKNHRHVLTFIDVEPLCLPLAVLRDAIGEPLCAENGIITAQRSFVDTCAYDSEIAAWLGRCEGECGMEWHKALMLWKDRRVRYGENPHQAAEVVTVEGDKRSRTLSCRVEQNVPVMSYNNYLDVSAATDLMNDLSRATNYEEPKPACVFIKHGNACGVAIADDPLEAYQKAYLCDPRAAMGGVLAVNYGVDVEIASTIMETAARFGHAVGVSSFFLEVWAAPSFLDDTVVVDVIQARKPWGKTVRLLDLGNDEEAFDPTVREYRSIAGGMLVQDRDLIGLNESDWKVVTKRKPTDAELADLRLAWLIAKHTKSNAISICKDGMLIGNGAGQMSRVMSCRIATWLAKENGHEAKLPGSVAASDGFFPFDDGPKLLMDAGVTAIIQPGGSKRDEEVIRACDERDVSMIFTGIRHFKH